MSKHIGGEYYKVALARVVVTGYMELIFAKNKTYTAIHVHIKERTSGRKYM